MDRIFSRGRLTFLSLLLATLLGLYMVTLYKLQIVEGAAYYESSTNSVVSTRTVKAARGDIMDRYGRLLVSNRTCNNIVIDEAELFRQDDPNAVLLQMVEIIESFGENYTDTMPITKEAPFEYVENMTSLQRSFLDGYLKKKGLAADTSAVELLAYCRSRYDIDPNYDSRQSRIIAGIRYEINGRYEVDTAPYIFAEDVNIDLITRLMESNLPGFDVEVSYIREYKTPYAAHLLGYVGAMGPEEYQERKKDGYLMSDETGKDGAEYAFESYLHGADGTARVTRTASGIVTGTTYTKAPVPGSHVYLTIDIGLQETAEQALANYITRENAKREEDNAKYMALGQLKEVKQPITGGGVAVVAVGSGEPLAVASYPTFDLATIMEDYSDLVADPNGPLFNRALNGIYAPGSTFKPVVAMAALCEGVITPTTTIHDDVVFDKYADEGYAPQCWIAGKGSHGTINVTGAIEVSCNYFFFTIGDFLQIDRINRYTRAFGLGEPTGIELSESTGTLTTDEFKMQLYGEPLYLGDTLQAAIGQGFHQFTPLQLANYVATMANGGTHYAASILKGVRSYDFSEDLYDRENEVLNVIDADAEYFKAITDGMYAVANSPMGTAFETFGSYSPKIAAKTGTAQMGEEKTNNAVFVCYAPAEDPEVAVAVAVEKGSAGSAVAVIAREVLDYYFSFKNSTAALETEMTLLK